MRTATLRNMIFFIPPPPPRPCARLHGGDFVPCSCAYRIACCNDLNKAASKHIIANTIRMQTDTPFHFRLIAKTAPVMRNPKPTRSGIEKSTFIQIFIPHHPRHPALCSASLGRLWNWGGVMSITGLGQRGRLTTFPNRQVFCASRGHVLTFNN